MGFPGRPLLPQPGGDTGVGGVTGAPLELPLLLAASLTVSDTITSCF